MLTPKQLAPLALLVCAGCITVDPGTAETVTYADLRQSDGWLLLDNVPLVTQETEDDCGAAALSMVLARWGLDVPPKTLQRECAVAGSAGLKAVDLRDAARRRGLSAYVIAGNVADLDHELRRGRPVIVGLVKTFASMQVTHFEVVVGLREPEQVAALDPARGLVCDAFPAFSAEWAATQGATLVVFRPEPKPQHAAQPGP
ncbi:MAG: C39 family peptidase [Planctomycetes bacterium]|nr:C39 family peptidase [Planctomycetota bacterium]